ncbi:coiled-coil domain-containing protein 183 isoform X2 [Etheostoma spectabile]|uniref:coiled-coil domain-containing protein 183 isoform X2 n=1 Tax=Etheostoma spectabile TaxID=54343 RepID=UPI0013AED2A8|nr:coiled-coil domain-containing protein 183 isoform X2 [Etheostoma spectabile]
MDFDSSTKMEDSRTLRRIKTSEEEMKAEHGAAKPLIKAGLPMEKRIEQEKRRSHVLINEHNRLLFAIKELETKLKELQESMKAKNLELTNCNSEDTCKQRIRQLENNLDKMKMKTTKAREIQKAYQHIQEHLQQEVCGMFKLLEQKQQAVAVGQAEVERAAQHFQSAATAADCTLGMVVQMEYEIAERKREMDIELCKLSAEEKELTRQIETLGLPSPTVASRLKEQEIEEEALPIPDTEHHGFDIYRASQPERELVEEMEALREALGCADVQELVNKVVSQRAIRQQLLTDVGQNEELVQQEAQTLAHLELQYTQLRFSAQPAATRLEEQKGAMLAELNEEMLRVERLQARLKQSQDTMEAIECGVDNLYFRMSCVAVEGLPTASCTESMDKLRDISARLPTLLHRASKHQPEISGLDQERVYSMLEQLNRMESRNIKTPSTQIHALQLNEDEDEEECCPSREEIKSCSSRLIEAEQNKKLSRRAKKKE